MASDGHNTLEEMVAAAQVLGLDYLGIADHSKSSVQARRLSEARLTAQIAEIGQLNASKKFKLPRLHRHGVRHPAHCETGLRRGPHRPDRLHGPLY
ncbi:MAG TPA: hypothetical protein VGD88_07520 [Opitutaceae bacterium]